MWLVPDEDLVWERYGLNEWNEKYALECARLSRYTWIQTVKRTMQGYYVKLFYQRF